MKTVCLSRIFNISCLMQPLRKSAEKSVIGGGISIFVVVGQYLAATVVSQSVSSARTQSVRARRGREAADRLIN